MRHLIACVVAVAVGAAAAVVVAERRPAALPHGWAEVVILGRDDAPIEGVTIRWDGHGRSFAETNAGGVARIDLENRGDSPSVFLGGRLQDLHSHTVGAPRTVVRIPDAVPIDVTFVDARTGATLVGGYVGWTEDRMNPVPTARPEALHRLTSAFVGFRQFALVEAPAGFVAPVEDLSIGPVSSLARRARMEIPAWPAGRVRVRVSDADGRPVSGAIDVRVSLRGDEERWTSVTADASGQATFDAMPLIPGEKLTVHVRRIDRSTWTSVRITPGSSEFDAAVTLPGQPDPTSPGTCSGLRLNGLLMCWDDLPPSGKSTLRLRVLRRAGTPARHVSVRIRGRATSPDSAHAVAWETYAVTDDDGRAVRDDLWVTDGTDANARKVVILLSDPGLAYTTADVSLAPGGAAECELREGEGQSIELTVVDAHGRPAPWVRVRAEVNGGVDYVWGMLDGDVQILAPRTGLDGRLLLYGLPSGKVFVLTDFYGHENDETLVAGSPATLKLSR